jgi:hypothetical protein
MNKDEICDLIKEHLIAIVSPQIGELKTCLTEEAFIRTESIQTKFAVMNADIEKRFIKASAHK